jgi:uncharacterized membrane protein
METYVGLAIITAILYGIGAILQKKGISKISEGFSINLKNIKKMLKEVLNKYFISGLILSFFGGLFFLASVSLGEISTIVPVINLNLVIVYILGTYYLKEKYKVMEWLGIGLIFFSIIVLSVSI